MNAFDRMAHEVRKEAIEFTLKQLLVIELDMNDDLLSEIILKKLEDKKKCFKP